MPVFEFSWPIFLMGKQTREGQVAGGGKGLMVTVRQGTPAGEFVLIAPGGRAASSPQ